MSDPTLRVLVVEDGTEYTDTMNRFLASRGFTFARAGSGPEALRAVADGAHDVVFLDMRFDRVPDTDLLGDLAQAIDRCNGDPVAGRDFLQEHQGTYVLSALREAGCTLPVLLSYDFSNETRRFARLAERHGPLDHCRDVASPDEVASRLRRLGAAR
ncbi:MAG: response regulator [Myxococcota bacterium]